MKLIFCSQPSRMKNKVKEIMDFVTKKNLAPLNLIHAFEFERFENGPIGREKTLEFCLRMIDTVDEFWIFGISEGVMVELDYFLKNRKGRPIKLFMDQFDPEWKAYYEQFKPRFGDLLSQI